jgi:hypothetical protein
VQSEPHQDPTSFGDRGHVVKWFLDEETDVRLWKRDGREEEWSTIEIPSSGVAFRRTVEQQLTLTGRTDDPPLAVVVPFEENGRQQAVVVTPAAALETILINGYRPLGVAFLRERDEIVVGSELLYFSTGGAVIRTPFPEDEAETRCSRCKCVLQRGDLALGCPCGSWFHDGALAESHEKPRYCATYEPACGGCERRWDELDWRPGDDHD